MTDTGIPDSEQSLLDMTSHNFSIDEEVTCIELKLESQYRDAAAALIALGIINSRFGGARRYIDLWSARFYGGEPHSEEIRTQLYDSAWV
jgi:hypothetical protein